MACWMTTGKSMPAIGNQNHDRTLPPDPPSSQAVTLTEPGGSILVSDHAQKSASALLGRVVEHLLGRALFDDDAVVHKDDAVGDIAGEAHLVGDDDHGHASLR